MNLLNMARLYNSARVAYIDSMLDAFVYVGLPVLLYVMMLVDDLYDRWVRA
jgi:hypothetical protein